MAAMVPSLAMSTRKLLLTLLLAVLAQLSVLAVVVFLGEPQRVGRPASHLHAADLAYAAVPLLLIVAAAWMPLNALLRARRRKQL